MSDSPAPFALTGRDATHDRAALARLVAFQRATPTAGLASASAEELMAELEHFRASRLEVAPEHKPWRRVADALVPAVVALPQLALWPAGAGAERAGPLVHDLALALARAGLEEADEIDLAVRWWQGARELGLPVDPDFGETWRAIEWMSLQQSLASLGRGPVEAGPLARAVRVALRYGPLKPLVALLQPLTGAATNAGYTF